MVRTISPSQKKQRKRQRLYLLLALVLSVSAAIALQLFSPSLRGVGRSMASLVNSLLQRSAGESPADAVLRGTIYDRSLRELAVSYRLFRLYVHPAEIEDRHRVAEALAAIVGEKREILEVQLRSRQRVVELADDLDRDQAAAVTAAGLAGVYAKAEEVRFYPGHTLASHALGFVGEGTGLAGIEGVFDTVLQPGEFRNAAAAAIDFKEEEKLGRTTTDLILTLDIELQKQLEARFRDYLTQQDAAKGMGVLLEPFSGRVLAVLNHPSFNPNYFWQADERVQRNRLYHRYLHKGLIQGLITRAAAIERKGLSAGRLLPRTVGAPDYGLSPEEVAEFEQGLQLFAPVSNSWSSSTDPAAVLGFGSTRTALSAAQMGVALASLVNGGWRITPYMLAGLYDHATGARYPRRGDSVERRHVLDPAAGVVIRRELFRSDRAESRAKAGSKVVSVTSSHVGVELEDGLSRYLMQELYVGMIPATRPKYLLIMAVEKDRLYPLPSRRGKKRMRLAAIGETMLTQLGASTPREENGFPGGKSRENLRRFFISKRLDFQEPEQVVSAPPLAMPQVTGLSLRKGLQRLNRHRLRLRISGSGTIVDQQPAPGASLRGIDECILTLESEI